MTETVPLQGCREIIETLLPTETVIYEAPDPSEAPRPDLPYVGIRTLSDRGLSTPYRKTTSIGPDNPGDPEDARVTEQQERQALVMVTLYGASSMARGLRISIGHASAGVIPVWRARGISATLAVDLEDVTELVGNRHEEAAQLQLWIRYRASVYDDVYSIKTTVVNYS